MRYFMLDRVPGVSNRWTGFSTGTWDFLGILVITIDLDSLGQEEN